MKQLHKFFFFFALLAFVASCGKNSDIPPVPLSVTIEKDGNIDYLGGDLFLRIETSASWNISGQEKADWLSILPENGMGNKAVVVTIHRNDAEDSRSCVLEIRAGNERKSIKITQQGFDAKLIFYPRPEAYRIEVPRLSNDIIDQKSLFVSHYAFDTQGNKRLNYSFEYSKQKRHTYWVAFTFDNTTSKQNTSRTDEWAPDPLVPLEFATDRPDYYGYDRGHLLASADRLFSREANLQTFYYSNMSPQINAFNGGIWAEMEGKVRSWGGLSAVRDTLYVVKGGTIRNDQVLTFNGGNKIPVPKYYFMALLALKNDTYKSIAFWFEHKPYDKPYDLKQYAISVKELETKTGINFFHNLPDAIENAVEKENKYSDWPGL